MFDLNDAQPQMGPLGDLIPDGTFARVQMNIRPGGSNGSVPMDAGLLKQSSSSDALMLDCEFTVVNGPYAKRKFWQMLTVSGGKLDDKGVSKGWNITKSTLRAMIDSATGLDPKDMSDEAKKKRVINGLKEFDGIQFAARIMIEPASNPQYNDQNKLANVVLANEPQYQSVMKGETVPPEPVNQKARKPKDNSSQASGGLAWQSGTQQSAGAGGQQGGQSMPPANNGGPAWLNG